MALINCPECSNNVSDKAETCPHCGIRLQVKSVPVQQIYKTTERGELLFSTKGLYDSAYWKEILPGIGGILVFSFLIAVVFSWLVGIIVYFVSLFIFYFTVTTKSVSYKKSYIDIYENMILGVSCIKNNE